MSSRISIRIPSELKAKVESIAVENKGTATGVILTAIRSYISNKGIPESKTVVQDIKDDIVPHYNHPLIKAMKEEGLVFYGTNGEEVGRANSIKQLFDFLLQNRQ